MKKLVLLFAILLNVSVFANTTKPASKIKSELRAEIVRLIGTIDFEVEETINTTFEFTVNSKGEVIVLSVNCKNEVVDSFIKNRLNYKSISTSVVRGEVYKLPIKLLSKK